MVTPWDLDSMRSDAELPFVSSRAVPVEGVQPTEATTRGMGSDRALGISIHSGHIPLAGKYIVSLRAVCRQWNGQNQILSDNNIPAVRVTPSFPIGNTGTPKRSGATHLCGDR